MSKPNKSLRRRNSRENILPWVQLPHWIMASAAWKSLRPVDRNVWLQIVWRYNGMNNGWIAVPARAVADEIGVHHSTVARALQALMAYGFIEITRHGDFSCKRAASEYRLTHLKCDRDGRLPGNTFMCI